MKTRKLLLLALSAIALVGCMKSEIDEATINSSNAISFSTSTDKLTKASVLTTTNATDYDFGVYAYSTGQSTWAEYTTSTIAEPNFMNNQLVEYDGGWTYSPTKYWPNSSGEMITFFAYMPKGDKTEASISTTTNLPEIVFTQVMDPEDMLDLTVAKVIDQEKTTSAVVLPFEHITTRLNFSAKVDHDLTGDDTNDINASNTTVYVKGLRVLGTAVNEDVETDTDEVPANADSKLYSEATYTLSSNKGAVSGAWDYTDAVKQEDAIDLADILNLLDQTYNNDVTPVSAVKIDQKGEKTSLLENGEYLFLIPPRGAEGVASSYDIMIQVDYDIITLDSSITTTGYYKSSTTATVSMPTGSLKEGLAYDAIITIGLDEVLFTVTQGDWVETDVTISDGLTSEASDIVTIIKNAFDAKYDSYAVTYTGNTYVAPDAGAATTEPDLEIDASAIDITDNEAMDLVINLPNQYGTVEITMPTDYTGQLTIYAPNATVTLAGDATYTNVVMTTADDTLIIAAGVTVDGLTINAGNVTVYGTLKGTIYAGADLVGSNITVADGGDISEAIINSGDGGLIKTIIDGIAYTSMVNAVDIETWKSTNADNEAALNGLVTDYFDFEYTTIDYEMQGSNYRSTSDVIALAGAVVEGTGYPTNVVDDYSITATTDVSNDVLPKLQAAYGTCVELPTQEELMYMWIFKGGNSFRSSYYWSSSVQENNIYMRWCVDFDKGETTCYLDASENIYARAVREIEL